VPNFRGIQRFMVTLGTPHSPSLFLKCGQTVGTRGRESFTKHLEPKPACFDENQRAIRVCPDKSVGEAATIGLC
jgi:hypothetical protein